MANIYYTLRQNPYLDIITPIMQTRLRRPPGREYPFPEIYADHADIARMFLSVLNNTWSATADKPCVVWYEPTPGTAYQTQSWVDTDKPCYRMTVARRRLRGLPAPGNDSQPSPLVTSIIQKLNSVKIETLNDHIYFSQMLDFFYENVYEFVDFFASDLDGGKFSDIAYKDIGIIPRQGSYLDGLKFEVIQQGLDANQSPSSTELIVSGGVNGLGDAGKYWAIYSSITERRIFWLRISGAGSAPSLTPVAGVNDTYYPIDILAEDSDGTIATKIKTAVDLLSISGLLTVGQVANTLTFTVNKNGAYPASFGDLPAVSPPFLVWQLNYTAGANESGLNEATQVSFKNAVAKNMNDRYFILSDTLGATTMFWYNVDGLGTEPTALADTKIEIVLDSSDTQAILQSKTDAAVTGVGFVLVVGASSALSSVYAVTPEGGVVDVVEGNSIKGIMDAVTEIKGTDGSTLATGLTTDKEFETAWNEIKVPYERAAGNPIWYIKSIGGEDKLEGAFIQTRRLSVVEKLPFNQTSALIPNEPKIATGPYRPAALS